MYVLETGQACLVLPDLSKHSYSGHTLCDRRHICPLSPGPGRWSFSLLPHASPPTPLHHRRAAAARRRCCQPPPAAAVTLLI